MSPAVDSVACGPYRILAAGPETLFEHEDGTVELFAESDYRVQLGPGARADMLGKALKVRADGREGTLRFDKFIGLARLGPRLIDVRSEKLDAAAVELMLDQVCDRLASLPFAVATPVAAPYERLHEAGPDVLYQAFAFLRDCMLGNGRRHLPEAIERILTRPHESLQSGEPRQLPLGAVSDFGAETLDAIQSEPEFLVRPAPGSPLAAHPVARMLGGTMPETVRERSVQHRTDNPENRFVVGMLRQTIDVLQRFERMVATGGKATAALNAGQARGFAEDLRRCLQHPVLAGLAPSSSMPAHSAVFRARPGYRELLEIFTDLEGRTGLAEADVAAALLELRDAPTIYEYWCYFRVVAAARRVLGPPAGEDSFAVDDLRARVPRGYRVRWPALTIHFNRSFAGGAGGHWPGESSYSSIALRPDIAVSIAGGGLHLFDPKLKVKFGEAAAGSDSPTRFHSEDLVKMHGYRDALGADSVWVLYPGSGEEWHEFPLPGTGAEAPFRGVGAIALHPSGGGSGLDELVERLAASAPG